MSTRILGWAVWIVSAAQAGFAAAVGAIASPPRWLVVVAAVLGAVSIVVARQLPPVKRGLS